MSAAVPTWDLEHALWRAGLRWVAGLDEAGRGAWAGPVAAAAVIFPPGCEPLPCLRDSKVLSPRRREACAARIRALAVTWAVGWASPREVDALGVLEATRRAMHRALSGLALLPEHLLLDHVRLPGVAIPQTAQPKADARVATVAAASILAKVARDAYMRAISPAFPQYGLRQHKGYGTRAHRAALQRWGPSPVHRLSYRPVARVAEGLA